MHSSTSFLIGGLVSGLLSSLFIYLSHGGLAHPALISLLGVLALVSWSYLTPKSGAVAGLVIGVLWFYWISLSFRFSDFAWMIPLVTLGIAAVYALYFAGIGWIRNLYLRALVLWWGFDLLAPMGFEWFKPEVMWADSYFGVDKASYGLMLIAVVAWRRLPPKTGAAVSALALLFALGNDPQPLPESLPKIKLATTWVAQDVKWDRENGPMLIRQNLDAIDLAMAEGYDAVVLPETVFPLYIDRHDAVLTELLARSYGIDIVTGGLSWRGGKPHNSTYLFSKGHYRIIDKVVLVPIAESAGFLPSWAKEIVNEIFFKGAQDYEAAVQPSDMEVAGVLFRNAICYEATTTPLFEDHPPKMIAMSNNAWYKPSIEPTLQRLVMTYFARRYHTVIWHSTNMEGSGIIR